jgi:hypothetical protein
MRRRRLLLLNWVLAAALLAGQWLAAAHEPDHALQPSAAHACAVCVYAHGGGSGLLPAIVRLEFQNVTAAPEIPEAAIALAVIARNHPIRGPPALLA